MARNSPFDIPPKDPDRVWRIDAMVPSVENLHLAAPGARLDYQGGLVLTDVPIVFFRPAPEPGHGRQGAQPRPSGRSASPRTHVPHLG
jgi:hypothetical protein